jgi:predicted dehydrogenase
LVGCGYAARKHLRNILLQTESTEVAALCEPSPAALAETAEVFEEAGAHVPPNEPDLGLLLRNHAPDVAVINTPHVYHYAQAAACLEAGVDVLLEKPMVMNAQEACDLIEVQNRTRKLLVIAFNGSLSPEIREAARLLRSGELGELLSISATCWQLWGSRTAGTWRQVPALSGGGFLFDTGAHMLNTVSDLAGEEFVEVAAWTSDHGRPVETIGVAIGKLASGALVTLHGCGETIGTSASDIRVFCSDGILRTGAWGQWLDVQRQGEPDFTPVQLPVSRGPWEQFLSVRSGVLANPSPPEVGLRMARLYDAVKASAAQGGRPVAPI